MDSSFNFQLKVSSIYLQIFYYDETIKIKGFTSANKNSTSLVYDAVYDDISLPLDIENQFFSVQQLAQKIDELKDKLQITQDVLVIDIGKKKLLLELKSKNTEDSFIMEVGKNQPHLIRPVKNILTLPYLATVLIESNSKIGPMNGSGVIINQNTVLTVAHIFYDKKKQTQATETYVTVQTSNGPQKIKVKKVNFPRQYKTINRQQMWRYDYAHLELQPNVFVTHEHVLPIKWNWIQQKQSFQVIGFSSHLDVQFNQNSNTMFHLRTDRTIKLLQSSIEYDGRAERGVSGGPLVVCEKNIQNGNENEVFKLIGLHQGFNVNFSRGVLLTSFGKNPLQILKQLEIPHNLVKDAPSCASIEKDLKIKKLQAQLNECKLKLSQKEDEIMKNNEKKQKKMEKSTKYITMFIGKPKSIVQSIFSGIGNMVGLDGEYKSYQKRNKEIKWKKQQKNIDLSQTNVTDEQLSKIGQQLQEMEQLNLTFCEQLNKIQLKRCKKLKKLKLSRVNISKIHLSQLTELEQLEISYCYSLKTIKLEKCQNIQNLNLRGTQIIQIQLHGLTRLELLNLCLCKQLKTIKINSCKSLKNIDLSGVQITQIQLNQLLNQLPELEQLNLFSCKQLKSITLNKCQELRKVNLQQSSVTEQAILQLKTGHANIQILS